MTRIVLLLCTLLVAGCSGISVDRDYDTGFDFTTLHRWAWATAPANDSNPQASSLVDERTRHAISTTLTARGFAEASEAAPDFLVRYYRKLEQPAMVDPEPRVGIGMGASSNGGGFGGISFHFGGNGSEPRELLVIDCLNPATGKLLWRGTAERAASSSDSPEEAQARTDETVQAILEAFPPGAKP